MLGVGYELIETVILLMLVTFLDKRLYNDEHYFKYTLLPCCYRSRNHLDFNEFTDVVNIEMAVISMALPGYNTDFYSLDLSKVCDDNEAVSCSSSSSSSPSSKYTDTPWYLIPFQKTKWNQTLFIWQTTYRT